MYSYAWRGFSHSRVFPTPQALAWANAGYNCAFVLGKYIWEKCRLRKCTVRARADFKQARVCLVLGQARIVLRFIALRRTQGRASERASGDIRACSLGPVSLFLWLRADYRRTPSRELFGARKKESLLTRCVRRAHLGNTYEWERVGIFPAIDGDGRVEGLSTGRGGGSPNLAAELFTS